MVTKVLMATSKFFTLLAVACGVLGLLSSNVAKADPPPCNCGSDFSDWVYFSECVHFTCPGCVAQCGEAVEPGEPGHAAWVACYNSYNNAILANKDCKAAGCQNIVEGESVGCKEDCLNKDCKEGDVTGKCLTVTTGCRCRGS